MKSSLITRVAVFCFSVLSLHVLASTEMNEPKSANSDAPEQLTHWNKMIGSWTTTEEGLKPDGSGWTPSKGALWNFHWAMDGWAIRDEYFSPPLATKIDDPNKRQIGTNIRIYNKDKNEWIMAWLTKAGQRVDVYSAESDGEKIVMYTPPLTEGAKHRRITFFDMRQNSFEWKMEYSTDGKTNWLEVYRIHGKRG